LPNAFRDRKNAMTRCSCSRIRWIACAEAGCVYALSVFAIGFVLGAIRVLVLAPRLGNAVAVALEVPFMLAVSWKLSRWSASKRGLLTDAALLGLIALLAWHLTKPWMRWAAALLALCATLPSEVRTPGEFLLHYAISLVAVIFELYFVTVQLAILKTLCIWCASYGLSLIARFFVAMIIWVRAGRFQAHFGSHEAEGAED